MALISTVSAFVWLTRMVIAKKLMIRAMTLLSSIKKKNSPTTRLSRVYKTNG